MRTQIFVLLALVAAVSAVGVGRPCDIDTPAENKECDNLLECSAEFEGQGHEGRCVDPENPPVDGCDEDADCEGNEAGEFCRGFDEDEGTFGTCGPQCEVNAECTEDDNVCQAGVCVEAECNKRRGCDKDQYCVEVEDPVAAGGGGSSRPLNGFCEDKVDEDEPCTDDIQCKSGKCDAEDGEEGVCEKKKKKKKKKNKKSKYGRKQKKSKKSKFGGYGKKNDYGKKRGGHKNSHNNKYGKKKSKSYGGNRYGNKNSHGRKY
jgi:hypothetical protein